MLKTLPVTYQGEGTWAPPGKVTLASEKSTLRKQAEARLAAMGEGLPELSSAESMSLIHELRTHQIELEMQNDELRRAESEMAEARDRFSELYDFAPVGYLTLSAEELILQANLRLANMLGVERSRLMQQRFSAFVVAEDQDVYYKHRKAVLASGQHQSVRLRLKCADGTSFWVRFDTTIAQGSDEGSTALLMAVSDIGEQIKAEAESHELIQAIGQVADGIMLTDAHGTIEYVNQAFTRSTGYASDEVIGKSPDILLSSHHNTAFYKEMWAQLINSGEWRGKIWNRRKNGEVYPEMLHINAIRGRDGEVAHYCAVYSDVSEQLSLEGQLLQSQKMEAIGTLVGGIAHDFNNMLAAITGGLYLLKDDTRAMPDATAQIEDIEKQCFRAADLIAQLMIFARKGTVHIRPMNLAAFLKEVFKLNRVSIPENIRLTSDISSEEMMISGDATQLQQVLLNLLANARDAVAYAEHPSVAVSLTFYDASPDFLLRHREVDGARFAHLSVKDNGYGIPKANMEHIFEPYFTSKAVGKGTGLGLAMVYGAVQSHHGVIEVESRVNEGTDVHIYLPLYEGKEAQSTEAKESAGGGQGETILLVDDEGSVRGVIKKVLESLGYKVIAAEDGKQAVEIFNRHHDSVDLLVLDVVMPLMGGVEAAKQMRAVNPQIPVIFLTGYDTEGVLAEIDDLPDTIALAKPLSFIELNGNIRALLTTNQHRRG